MSNLQAFFAQNVEKVDIVERVVSKRFKGLNWCRCWIFRRYVRLYIRTLRVPWKVLHFKYNAIL